MKPLILKMDAFGSYAKPTTVAFEKFRKGLFLVTGDTGAGKTTIFDAIVFALFGTGSGEERTLEMMHSDYVSKDTDTSVELTFEQSGKTYTVKRSLHFTKKRGKENEYGNAKIDAVLILPDDTTVKGASKVTERVTEILGLNKDQFRQIVMLAQGEFRRFLKSNSDEKSAILGKLFDNSIYLRYEQLITAAAARLKEERKDSMEHIETLMEQVFMLPEETDDDQMEEFLPGNPDLLESLTNLIKEDQKTLNDASDLRSQKQKKLDELNTAYGTAKTQNNLIDQLANAEAHLKTLEDQKDEYEALHNRNTLVSNVFHKVMPADQNARNAENDLIRLKGNIESLTEDLAKSEGTKAQAEETVRNDEGNRKEIENLTRRIQTLSDTLPEYEKIEKAKNQLEQRKKDNRNDAAELDQTVRDLKNLNNSILEAQKESAQLKDAEGLKIAKTAELEKLDVKLKECDGDHGLRNRLSDIHELQRKAHTAERELTVTSKKTKDAKEEYDRLYTLYFNGQSGILAEELRKELDLNGSAICPVCGTHFVKGQETHFAHLEEGVPTQAEVEAAKENFETLDRNRQKKYNDLNGQLTSIDHDKSEVLHNAQKIFDDCESFEVLDGDTYLSEKIFSLKQEIKTLKAIRDKAKKDAERYKDLIDQIEKDQKTQLNLTGKEKSLSASVSKEAEQITKDETELEERRKTLPFESSVKLNAHIKELSSKKTGLETLISDHLEQFQKAQNAYNKLKGSLETEKKKLPDTTQKHKDTKAFLEQVLSDYGFETIEKARNVLEDIYDPDAWLKETEQNYRDYLVDVEGTRTNINTLRQQTKGHEKTDLNVLNETILLAKEEYDNANEYVSKINGLLRNHKTVYTGVKEEKAKLADSDQAYTILSRLAELAAGTNAEGGRLSFDRYVMSATFREIIEKANIRLEVMSGGQYELVHQAESYRRNAVAGLDIEVLDRNTGIQRESASLSGGESFIVSLALALGLSDVVQSHAGGQSLDTLFIDEGFGTLDDAVLDRAVEVLNSLSDDEHHLVGIISHVARLEESIVQKIVVRNSSKGSSLHLEGVQG